MEATMLSNETDRYAVDLETLGQSDGPAGVTRIADAAHKDGGQSWPISGERSGVKKNIKLQMTETHLVTS